MPRGKKSKKSISEEITDIIEEIETEINEEIIEEVQTEHSKKLEELLKEVELFTTEGDFEIKTNWLGTVLTVIVVIAILGVGVFLFVNRNTDEDTEEEKNQTDKVEYRYSELETAIEFFKNDELINTYNCTNECGVYSENGHGLFSKTPTVIVLYDGADVFLYNYVEDKVISDNFVRLQNMIYEGETFAFLVHGSTAVGVIDLNGKIKVPLEYLNLGFSIDDGEVSDFSTTHITARSESGWGLITLRSNKEVIPFEHDDIFYNGHNRVAIYENNLWYLLDLEGNEVLSDGYDMVIPIGNRVFAARNSNFYIFNSRGNPIISSEIPTYVNTFRSRIAHITPAFELEVDGSIINITINNPSGDDMEYQFNTVNGKLTEVIR